MKGSRHMHRSVCATGSRNSNCRAGNRVGYDGPSGTGIDQTSRNPSTKAFPAPVEEDRHCVTTRRRRGTHSLANLHQILVFCFQSWRGSWRCRRECDRRRALCLRQIGAFLAVYPRPLIPLLLPHPHAPQGTRTRVLRRLVLI